MISGFEKKYKASIFEAQNITMTVYTVNGVHRNVRNEKPSPPHRRDTTFVADVSTNDQFTLSSPASVQMLRPP